MKFESGKAGFHDGGLGWFGSGLRCLGCFWVFLWTPIISVIHVISVGHTLKCNLGVQRPSHRNPM